MCVVACSYPQWKSYQNTHAIGGNGYPEIRDEDTCREQCLIDTKCVAMDIDLHPSATILCWLHHNQANLATRVTATNITHYVLVDRCPPLGNSISLLLLFGAIF